VPNNLPMSGSSYLVCFLSQTRYGYPEEDNPLLYEVSTYVEACGLNDAFKKIYITTKPLDNFPVVTFLYVIAHLPKFAYDQQTGARAAL